MLKSQGTDPGPFNVTRVMRTRLLHQLPSFSKRAYRDKAQSQEKSHSPGNTHPLASRFTKNMQGSVAVYMTPARNSKTPEQISPKPAHIILL